MERWQSADISKELDYVTAAVFWSTYRKEENEYAFCNFDWNIGSRKEHGA